MQILALGNAKIYQHVGISNAKLWRREHCPTPIPDARYFVSQQNIGFSCHLKHIIASKTLEMHHCKDFLALSVKGLISSLDHDTFCTYLNKRAEL